VVGGAVQGKATFRGPSNARSGHTLDGVAQRLTDMRNPGWIVVGWAVAAVACSRPAGTGDESALSAASETVDAGRAPTDSTGSLAPPPTNGGAPSGTPSDSPGDEPCAVLDATSTLTRLPVDIVWVVDDSGSMRDEQARIRENISRFASQITEAGIDMHVVIVTESDLAQGTALEGDPRYKFVDADVGSHNSLEVLLDDLPSYRDRLRPEAQTHFVAVTDDESDLSAASFQSSMEAALGHPFTFHAVASENVGGDACRCTTGLLCGAAAPGDEYYALAAATKGEQVSICTLDWGAVFDRLIAAVVAGAPLPCTFALPEPPDGETLDKERVKFVFEGDKGTSEIPRLGGTSCGVLVAWQYDAKDSDALTLCPAACEALNAGGTVHIALGCAPNVIQ